MNENGTVRRYDTKLLPMCSALVCGVSLRMRRVWRHSGDVCRWRVKGQADTRRRSNRTTDEPCPGW